MEVGTYTLVPLRFYRDGQFLAGIGSFVVLGTWELDPRWQSNYQRSFTLALDKPAPQLFGTDDVRLRFNVTRAGDSFIRSDSQHIFPGQQDYDDATPIGLECARYNGAGEIEGDDLPTWMGEFEEMPVFIVTGEASIQLTPRPPSPWDVALQEGTAPVSDESTPEPVTQTPTSTPPVTAQPSANAPLAEVTALVKDIWYTGDFVDTIDGVRQLYGSVIEFNNGEVSRDGETISHEGIAASKRKNPEDWGEGRVSGSGLLSYKWRNSRSWYEPYLSAPTRAYPRNQKIRGCFANSVGVEGSGSTPRIDRLCFSVDGDFTVNDSANYTGTYLIDGHAIRLDFSNGEREEFLFGAHYFDGFIYRLIIADSVYHATR